MKCLALRSLVALIIGAAMLIPTRPAFAQELIMARLDPLGGSSVSGTATLTKRGNQTHVPVVLDNAPAGTPAVTALPRTGGVVLPAAGIGVTSLLVLWFGLFSRRPAG